MKSLGHWRSFRILLTGLLLSICVPVVKSSFQFRPISRTIEGQDLPGVLKLTSVPLTSDRATFAGDAGASSVTAAASAATARLLNISSRARVQTGDDVLIGGFIITASGTKRVVLRGLGPSLAAAGVPSVLADPVLELHKPNGKVITNDDWPTARVDVQTTGIAPPSVKESAIVANLPSGNYTVILRGMNNANGIGLVEVYDLDTMAVSELVNISSRGVVGTGDNVLIGGIIVGPSAAASSTMLARAIGPSLARFGVNNPLLDPTLELHNKDGVLIASNDNWKDIQRAAIQATKAPPSDDRESALVFTASPGNYTAIVRGRNDGTGVALVEVYNLH